MATKSKREKSKGRKKDEKTSKKKSAAPDAPAEETVEAQGRDIEKRLEELEEELHRVRQETAHAEDRALRTLAEFDNYRRRNEKELREVGERGAADVLGELLDIADHFDRALEHVDEGVPESFLEGFRLVAKSVHDLLDRRGVKRMETVGETFDPRFHEALTSQPADGVEPNTVLQEVQPGYLLGEKVLRPAKVIVARADG